MVLSKMILIIPLSKGKIRSIAAAALPTSKIRDYRRPNPFEPVVEPLKLDGIAGFAQPTPERCAPVRSKKLGPVPSGRKITQSKLIVVTSTQV